MTRQEATAEVLRNLGNSMIAGGIAFRLLERRGTHWGKLIALGITLSGIGVYMVPATPDDNPNPMPGWGGGKTAPGLAGLQSPHETARQRLGPVASPRNRHSPIGGNPLLLPLNHSGRGAA